MVVYNPDIIDNEGVHGAPNLIIEVSSSESKQRYYNTKLTPIK